MTKAVTGGSYGFLLFLPGKYGFKRLLRNKIICFVDDSVNKIRVPMQNVMYMKYTHIDIMHI